MLRPITSTCQRVFNETISLTVSKTRRSMAHVVTSKCKGCKFTDCVEVCPVACFYELENQLIILPDECIDCTACVSECPVQAIYAEGDLPVECIRVTKGV